VRPWGVEPPGERRVDREREHEDVVVGTRDAIDDVLPPVDSSR
jgi:hypothetical protein